MERFQSHRSLVPSLLFFSGVLAILLAGSGCIGQINELADKVAKRSTGAQLAMTNEVDVAVLVEKLEILGQPREPVGLPNSFAAVTAKLDQGGGVFGYISTACFLASLTDEMMYLREAFLKEAEGAEMATVRDTHKIVSGLLTNSGLQQLSGVGFSSVAATPEIFRTKFMLHHEAGAAAGFLWRMFGSEPHEMVGLSLLPSSTAAAGFTEVDLTVLWEALNTGDLDNESGSFRRAIAAVPAMVQGMTKMSLEQLFAAMGREIGLILTLDESRLIPVPVPAPEPVQIPTPSLMLVLKPDDDTLFVKLEELVARNRGFTKATNGHVRLLTMTSELPILPGATPAVAYDGELLIAGTSLDVINEALAIRVGEEPGLKDDTTFKGYADLLPNHGNGFTYVTKRFSELINQTRAKSVESGARYSELMESFSQAADSLQVSQVTEEGWIWTGITTVEPANAFLSGSVGGGSMVFAGMLWPALAKAKAKAAEIKCANGCRMVQVAKEKWAEQNGRDKNAIVTLKSLVVDELVGPDVGCPEAGRYVLGRISDHVNCTKHNHKAFAKAKPLKAAPR